MKRIYGLLFLLLGFSLFTHAQNDPKAKTVLDNVSNKIKNVKGFTANFTYSTRDRNKNFKGTVKGQISVKGQKYYIKQGQTEIFSNGTKIWNYNGEDEVTVSDVDNDDNRSLSPQKLLTNFYDQDFSYSLVSSAGNFYEIKMVPTDKRKSFKQVNVFVDKSKNLITKAKVIDKSDNTIEFALSNINTNASLPDSRFSFDAAKHPNVEVVAQ